MTTTLKPLQQQPQPQPENNFPYEAMDTITNNPVFFKTKQARDEYVIKERTFEKFNENLRISVLLANYKKPSEENILRLRDYYFKYFALLPEKEKTIFEQVKNDFLKYSTKIQIIKFNELYQHIENNTPDIKPLAKKINWIKDISILQEHLLLLKEHDYLTFQNIEKVMSGDEIPVVTKKTGSPYNFILGLFEFWDGNFISNYIDSNTQNYNHKMIIASFKRIENKEIIKNFIDRSLTNIMSNRKKYIDDIRKIYIDSLLK